MAPNIAMNNTTRTKAGLTTPPGSLLASRVRFKEYQVRVPLGLCERFRRFRSLSCVKYVTPALVVVLREKRKRLKLRAHQPATPKSGTVPENLREKTYSEGSSR